MSTKKSYIKVGKNYKCLVCGTIGNWKEVITSGRCHNVLGQADGRDEYNFIIKQGKKSKKFKMKK